MIETNDDDPHLQDLVAYLDGELERHEVSRVERRLAEDAEYRAALQRLQRAWSLLDELPRTTPSTEFTESTLTMAAQSIAGPRRSSRAGWRPWAFGAVAVALVAGASYWAVARRLAAPEQQFLRDLPVIQNVDAYQHVENLEFLRELLRRDVFPPEDADA